MCKALQELMQPELDEMKIKGRAEGREEGQNALLEAIFALKDGQTSEGLLASGYDVRTIERAEKAI